MRRRFLMSVAVEVTILLGAIAANAETIISFGDHAFSQGTATGSAVITVTGNEPVDYFTLVLKVEDGGPKITGIDFTESGFVFAAQKNLAVTTDVSGRLRGYADVSTGGTAGSFTAGNLARVTFDFSDVKGTGPWAVTFSDSEWGDSDFVQLPNEVYQAGSIVIQEVPEPATVIHLLVAGGLASLVAVWRKRNV
jgi:hypothetical protein